MNKTDARAIKLMTILRERQTLDVQAAVTALRVSEATARRLFARLETEGRLIRTHGGVRLAPQLGYDYSYREAAGRRAEQKALIAAMAATYPRDGDRLFLDSGTTTLKFSEALAARIRGGGLKAIVVVTNSLTYMETLADCCSVTLLGGEVRPERRDTFGPLAERNLAQYRFDKAFLGADAASLRGGLMATDDFTARMNELTIAASREVFVLADSEKFGLTSFVRYAALGDVTRIVTDPEISEETLREFRAAGAAITVAGD